MAHRRRVDGILRFPWLLPVGPDVLGARLTSTIGGVKITIDFPTFAPDDPASLTAPPVRYGQIELSEGLIGKLHMFDWGLFARRTRRKTYMIAAARTSFLVARDAQTKEAPEIAAIVDSQSTWFEVVQSWLMIRTGVPPEPFGLGRATVDMAIEAPDGRIATTTNIFDAFRSIKVDVVPATFRQVQGAFNRASKGDRPPVEHSLIANAKFYNLEGDHRRAVIDATTAAEVALAKRISTHLRKIRATDDLIERIIRHANGVAGLADLCTDLGVQLPVSGGKIRNELARERNKAAHQGVIPSASTTETAIEHATRIVNTACPLPEA